MLSVLKWADAVSEGFYTDTAHFGNRREGGRGTDFGAQCGRQAGEVGEPSRAVQRSIHEAHCDECVEAAEGDAMPGIGDVMDVVEP